MIVMVFPNHTINARYAANTVVTLAWSNLLHFHDYHKNFVSSHPELFSNYFFILDYSFIAMVFSPV